MGKHFGNLQKLKGVYYYTLSPLEINPLIMLRSGFANAVRKSIRALAIVAVPASMAGYTYYWGSKTYIQCQRKNPEDYKDDV